MDSPLKCRRYSVYIFFAESLWVYRMLSIECMLCGCGSWRFTLGNTGDKNSLRVRLKRDTKSCGGTIHGRNEERTDRWRAKVAEWGYRIREKRADIKASPGWRNGAVTQFQLCIFDDTVQLSGDNRRKKLNEFRENRIRNVAS